MTPKPETIATYAELCARVRELQKHHRVLVFRGQTAFYSARLVPSALRPNEALGNHNQYEIDQLQDRWLHPLARALVELPKGVSLRPNEIERPKRMETSRVGIESFGLTQKAIEAILQHYGARSHYIDVTKSVDVALWFSLYRHRMSEVKLPRPPDVLRHEIFSDYPPVYDVAWYEPAWKKSAKTFGYFFVIAPRRTANPPTPDNLRHGDLVDVSDIQMFGRMRRQQAGLIYVSGNHGVGDIGSLVKAIYRFALPLRGAPALKWKTTKLFPPPTEDPLWAKLLSELPFRQVNPRIRSQTRLLQIPEYYDKADCLHSKEWREYRMRDVYINPSFVFHALRTAKNLDGSRVKSLWEFTCMFGNKKYDVRSAKPVLTLLPSASLFVHQPPAEYHPPIDPLSLFLEYDAIQALRCKDSFGLPFVERVATGSQSARVGIYELSVPFIRAVWLIQHEKTFWCRLFGFDGDQHALHISEGHFFRWKRGKLTPLNLNLNRAREDIAEDERIALMHTLGLLSGIERRTTFLAPPMKGWSYVMLATGAKRLDEFNSSPL